MQVETNPEAIARGNLEQKLSSRTNLHQPSTTTATEPHESIAKAATTSPEATARVEPRPHGPDKLDGGAHSTSAPAGMAAHARKRTREPRAQSQAAPTGIGAARHKTSPRKAKTSHISCTNNAHSPKLKKNGGAMELGTPSQCFRKGFGGGFYQKIDPAHLEEFLADFSAPYKKIVHQNLFYGDGAVPPGMVRATLSQCMQRGFGVGSMQLAKRILKEREQATGK